MASKALSAHFHQWDVLTSGGAVTSGKRKKEKREPRVCRVFKATLDWVTKKNPTLPYEERCKKAAEISRVTKKNGFRLPGSSTLEKRAAIWQRRLEHERSEKEQPRVAITAKRQNNVVFI